MRGNQSISNICKHHESDKKNTYFSCTQRFWCVCRVLIPFSRYFRIFIWNVFLIWRVKKEIVYFLFPFLVYFKFLGSKKILFLYILLSKWMNMIWEIVSVLFLLLKIYWNLFVAKNMGFSSLCVCVAVKAPWSLEKVCEYRCITKS